MAEDFAVKHPSDRMRLHTFGALASVASDSDTIWARAERSGSRMVAMEATASRKGLNALGIARQ